MSLGALFQPFACKSLRAPNRIAMASMARWSTPDGDPAPLADFYRRRVEGGTGLILTEGTTVERPAAGNDPASPRMFGPALEGWRKVVDAVHAAGGAIVPQLWHCGATAKPGGRWSPPAPYESPSGLQARDIAHGQAMTEADIDATLAAYAAAAAAAKALGFDGVEIHAGHGYLLDQFFWDQTNQRDDRWGGTTLVERSRFPLEVVRAVRAAVGDGFAVLMRISQWKSADLAAQLVATPAELEAWLRPFVDGGVDMISVSQLRYDNAAFGGSDLSLAGWVRAILGVPTIVAGGVGMSGDFIAAFGGETGRPKPVDDVARRLDLGEFDMVAVGRGLLADPDWAERLRRGASRSECAQTCLFPGLD